MKPDRLSQPFLRNAPDWWQIQEGTLFDIYQNYVKIASCSVCLVERQRTPNGPQKYFPNTWFWSPQISETKPVLEIVGLATRSHKNQEYGRLVLQALYQKSILFGCDGRMQVFTSFNSAPFYEHCGFSGGKKGVDGLKFFDPTPQSLSALFKKGNDKYDLKFILADQRKIGTKNRILKAQKDTRQRG